MKTLIELTNSYQIPDEYARERGNHNAMRTVTYTTGWLVVTKTGETREFDRILRQIEGHLLGHPDRTKTLTFRLSTKVQFNTITDEELERLTEACLLKEKYDAAFKKLIDRYRKQKQ